MEILNKYNYIFIKQNYTKQMVQIKVLVDTIEKQTFQKILDYYNNNKELGEQNLERLDRVEGGFQIKIPQEKLDSTKQYLDPNEEIRQLRWSRGYLTSGYYIGFTQKQYMLLYDALVYALPGSVILE